MERAVLITFKELLGSQFGARINMKELLTPKVVSESCYKAEWGLGRSGSHHTPVAVKQARTG